MPALRQILSELGLDRPDGRPIYALPISPEQHAEIRKQVRLRVLTEELIDGTAARFVLWAAEHIRAHFRGGQLSWEFLFKELELREKKRTFTVQLVERGLRYWGRKVRKSEAGHHLYLYTLMAEGGLPQALLVQPGNYQRVVKSLLAEIEGEGTDIPEAIAYRIAERRVTELPQTFQSEDIARLLADLALALVRLRADCPPNVPLELIDRWLDQERPDWAKSLPLRVSRDVADKLIRPVLRSDRAAIVASGPLAWRCLVRNDATGWKALLRIADQGVLAGTLLPEATGLRLRLMPIGAATERSGALIYSAVPEENGWMLKRIAGAGIAAMPLELDAPFSLAAFADGRMVGEVEVTPAMPSPDEAPSLWRSAGGPGSGDTDELSPLSGSGKTRASSVWLLSGPGDRPVAGQGLDLYDPEPAPGGMIWRVSGKGELRLGARCWTIATGSDEETPDARLLIQGEILSGWRLAGTGGPIFCGKPKLLGQKGAGSIFALPAANLRTYPAKQLMGTITEWVVDNAVLARLRYVALPADARLQLRETAPASLELRVEGLPAGVSVALIAASISVRAQLQNGGGRVVLSVPGAPPGVLTVRLSDPARGTPLDLVVAWPARNGVILTPDGSRVERDAPLSVDALRGWRAILPEGLVGDIQLRLGGHVSVTMRASGDVALAAHIPLIRSMLAQAGPDAQVNVSLITGGVEGRRLEIRRYTRQAVVHDGRIRFGLPRDAPVAAETVFSEIPGRYNIVLHAVDLSTPGRSQMHNIEGEVSIDPRSLLPEDGGPWLIQALHNGQTQRAVVWARQPLPSSVRDERIRLYGDEWISLLQRSQDPSWDSKWRVIRAAAEGGDAGVLDQVQALSRVPAAALALALRVARDELNDVFALDLAAPIFWPALPISAFRTGLTCEHARLVSRYMQVLDQAEAEKEAGSALAKRIEAILVLHPELAVHMSAGLMEAGLIAIALTMENREALKGFFVPDDARQLLSLAHEAARRFDRLPGGLSGIIPHSKPANWPSFVSYAQAVIDAPLVAAEIAAGLRPAPSTASMLRLINLRLVDPHYFDSALPSALAFILRKSRS